MDGETKKEIRDAVNEVVRTYNAEELQEYEQFVEREHKNRDPHVMEHRERPEELVVDFYDVILDESDFKMTFHRSQFEAEGKPVT